MKAVIMAGGLGERLKPFTQVLPKPLLPLGSESILEITLKRLRDAGFTEVWLTLNYKSHLFQTLLGDGSRLGIKLKYSEEEKKLGTVGPLTLIKQHLTEPFLVMNGDILTNLDFKQLIEFHKKNNAALTMVTKKITLPLRYGVVKADQNCKVTDIIEKPEIIEEINAGIYIISPQHLNLLPYNEQTDMPDFIRLLLKNNQPVFKHQCTGQWLDIGRLEDYEKAQSQVSNGDFC